MDIKLENVHINNKLALLHEPGSGETGRHASGSEMS
jgi:hypothetical protein